MVISPALVRPQAHAHCPDRARRADSGAGGGATAGRSPRRAATWAVFVVAVPLAFFGTFFRTERKYYPSQGGSPTVRAVVGASCIRSGFPSGKVGVHRHRQVLPAHSLCRFGPYRKKFIFRNLNFLQNNYSPHHRALRRSST